MQKIENKIINFMLNLLLILSKSSSKIEIQNAFVKFKITYQKKKKVQSLEVRK